MENEHSTENEYPMKKALRAAAYARVSTDKDDQINSLENQKIYFTEYIRAHKGWILTEIYYDV